MAPRRRCLTCGSKQWHKEPSSGLIACSEGHVLQNYRSETTEITEVGPHAMKKRTLKSRRKKGKANSADPKLYHGARGRYHYFLCLQLILRKQIAALTQLWELPPEFEIICRDLWALNLALLPDPPPAEPYHHAQETRVGPEGDASAAKQGSDSGSEDENDNEKKNSSDDDEEGEEEEEDAELEALMEENSDLSSSSEDETGQIRQDAGKPKKKAKGRFGYESPLSTIAVLVVACWMMRIPVMYRDFTRMIERYEIPYLDGVRSLPGNMVEHLTKHHIQALSPPYAPRTMAMHKIASRLAKKLNANYGIYTPEANAASILWRITKEMGGTPLLYRLTKRVASVLSVPLTLHWTLSPGLAKVKAGDGFRHHYDGVPPEVGLLGSLIIVVKMVYGLDGTARGPEDGEMDDVACGFGSAQDYVKLIGKMAEGDRQEMKFDTRKRLQGTRNVGDMTSVEIDEYIAFCSEVLGNESRLSTCIEMDCGVPAEGTEKEWTSEVGLDRGTVETMLEGGRRVRAGEEYKIWNSRDVDGTLPDDYLSVLSRGEEMRDKKDKKQQQQQQQQSHTQTPLPLLLPPSSPSPASSLSTPQLSIASDPAHESASSSSHSNSLPTPNDELVPKRSWRNWIGAKRSSSFKLHPPSNQFIPEWPLKPESVALDDDDSHENYEHLYSPVSPAIRAHDNLSVLLRNSLVPPLAVSPFVQHNLGPFFPRSSNRPSLLAVQSDTRKEMFAAHLLSRLSDLSPSELSSITPFASKPTYSLLSPPPPNFPNASHPVATHTKAFPSSPGLRRWISRPCFEDRHQVYLATDSGVVCLPVSAASLAVAALEYSEHIDVMIDPDFDQYPTSPARNVFEPSSVAEPTTQATQSHAPAPVLVETTQPPAAQKRNSYTAAPSPLRNQHSPPLTPKTILKRNVRFAEDDSDPEDGLPLHVIRMKKKREQKADFLRLERLKRVREEQEERHQLELQARQEAVEKEQRRHALEKERREKEKVMYAETIAATRARRESHRAGVVPLNNPSSNLLAASPSFSSLKDSERNKPANSRRFSRSPQDPPPSLSIPRRDSSDSAMHLNTYNAHQYDSSPGSSRPPSIGYSPNSPSSPNSRPPSTYSAHTSSSEDVRHHHHSGSRRNSMNAAAVAAASSSIYARPPMIVSYPTWSGSNPNFQYIPPVPPFPDFVHDMPLLPPTAPFMKPSYKSRSSSSSRSRKESYNSSSERVNRVPPPQSRTPSSSRHPQRQSSASSLPRPTHHRTGSGESRNTSRTQSSQQPTRPMPTTSHSHPNLSRGRPMQPQYLQAPTPWTPLPTQMMTPQMVMMPSSFPYAQMGLVASASNLHNAGGGSTNHNSRGYRRPTQPVIS
ncbi:hypothetical protein CVT25_009875 [Psilocybe cyanescens]|uniref:Uncharacterized protein n=1 Tax=Psilocybe cyanescens TaxID=93625 RepID=A0A409XTJ9_PSICY|nr:hypothetical protein CVT25_009875 [Psilocybe cyanescens]